MIALRAFELNGRLVGLGEFLQVIPIEASILLRKQYARFATPSEVVAYETRVLEPKPRPEDNGPAPTTRRRQRHRRRDLVADLKS